MSDILRRDIDGKCVGECRDRVREGEEERQVSLESANVSTPDSYPNAPGANRRNNPPGEMGGHV